MRFCLLWNSLRQQEITCVLQRLLDNEKRAQSVAEETIDNIDMIKKAILTRVFRGELGTNIPEEKSSIELLKFILA